MSKPRRKAVKSDVFVREWVKGCKAGLTTAQIAEGLGMSVNSCTVRASQLRKLLQEEQGVALPSPNGQGGGGKKLDLAELAATVKALTDVDADGEGEDGESDESAA